MFSQIKNFLFPKKKAHNFKVVKHSFFRDDEIAEQLLKEGYYVADFLGEEQRLELRNLFGNYHQLGQQQEGVFFGVFSRDMEYRTKVHHHINKVLATSFDKWFVNYKSVINNFVVKTPGGSTFVPIHQDGAALNEEKYSSINVWIPLQATNHLNGTLRVIPRSHHIFSPYRCNTIPPIMRVVEDELYPYFIPLALQAGQVIFFDSRIFHYSEPNLSQDNRLAIVCRICPVESKVTAYYKDQAADAPVEIWECPDTYLIDQVGYNDATRPEGARLVGTRNVDVEPLSRDEFEKRRIELGIERRDENMVQRAVPFNFLQEPKL